MRLVLLSLALMAGFAQAEPVRFVFKGAQFGAHKMTFGLSSKQVEKILALSGDRVNLGDVYYVEGDSSQLAEFQAKPGFSGMIRKDVPPPGQVEQAQPTGDVEFTDQWWVRDLGVKQAWTMATGLGVTVADCDAGFYHDESDLHDNFLLDYRFDLSNSDDPLTVNDGPYAYHGTAVTSIIAGVMDGKGTNGIAFNAKIVPLQNYNYDSNDKLDKEEATAKCVLKAIDTPDVDVIVLENQTVDGSSETFVGTRDAVRLALQAGIIVVSAAGNYSAELKAEIQDDTGSIIVGALNEDGTSAPWSNYGDRVTVGAFGENLHTLYGPNGQFGDFGGTSGATPQVAATVALMKEANPGLTPAQARQLLQETRDLNDGNKKTGGRLLTDRAVEAAKNLVASPTVYNQQLKIRKALQEIL
jgi:subtilisin family serine protease